jgi:hypothetical protein
MITVTEDVGKRTQHPQPKEPPQPEPAPPEEPKEPEPEPQPSARVAFTAGEFQQVIQAVIKEARKPVVDERTLARQKRTREHNQMLARDQREMLINRFRSCNHMQMPGSVMTGCASIAWATQSDGKRRGTCQHCGTVFSPVREECLSEEIWKAYSMLVRLPTHPAGNINNIFQSA